MSNNKLHYLYLNQAKQRIPWYLAEITKGTVQFDINKYQENILIAKDCIKCPKFS